MVPFRQFLLKIHSRCNLACDYCYVYEAADRSWRDRPRRMELPVVRRTARRIAEHAAEHGLDEVAVVLHGGEPLLVGAGHLDALLGELADLGGVAGAGPRVRFSLQTNGLRLLDEPALLDVLHRYQVGVGVSLDGTRADHDRHRLLPSGAGSWERTAEAVRLLGSPEHRSLFAGLLCVVDLSADPVATYEALLEFAPPRLDLLLPHATWQEQPAGVRRALPSAPPGGGEDAPYGEWLIAAFDRWFDAPRRETGVRLFEELAVLVLGGRAASEAVGLAPVDLVVIEADGAIEQADSLKVAFDGAAATGLDVWRHGFADAAAHPAFLARQRGVDGLGAVCGGCPVVRVCGGGLYAHRYAGGGGAGGHGHGHGHGGEAGRGFGHPSVYCVDLDRLIRHVVGRLRGAVGAAARGLSVGVGSRVGGCGAVPGVAAPGAG
ncbi:FxsB family radical SAM/SPASM domain protein [Streptomyces sp. SP17BM10]|uniref:FxsB family cyclophane-forming radical SAM/SPASM peptide maturase n=1 Tax=Streptomyces sp. SP17BM10 TaxID=3002530 RepID=UPI002E7A0B62|nr:FxsB family cyclophane-forming radical SAM/SPASM peptide maturase [Streptomyces sp. SP17BM10]MEE1789068.1 FxsB family radical SAM/SPASM domain protein [Streptomyces sp. SP17BM10]